MIVYDENCPDSPNIITCRFKVDPDYSPMITLAILISFIFIVLPRCISFLNFLIFNKMFDRWSLIEFIFHKKEKLVKKFTSKRKEYLINSEFTQYFDTTTGGPDYEVMRMMRAERQLGHIQFGNINQVAPMMLYTE